MSEADKQFRLCDVEIRYSPFRVVLFVLVAFLSVAFYWGWPAERIGAFIQNSVFYFSLGASAAAFLYLFVCAREALSLSGSRKAFHSFLPAFVGCCLLFLHADFGFKVSMDDSILSASAKSLYQDQEYFFGIQGHYTAEGFEVDSGYLDKRPWFYPFAVSVLHYFSGWRLSNAFLANALFGAAFMFIISACGWRMAGGRGAWLAVLLAASVPLVAQNATSGGMDMANAALFALLFLLGTNYLKNPNRKTEGALLSVAVLLAYTRYESLLYLGPVVLILVVGWYLRKQVLLSVPALLLAPLLLPVFLQNRYFRQSELLWELSSSEQSPFGLVYVVENLSRAVYFFFNFSDTLANSAVASFVGLVSIVLILVWSVRNLPASWREKPALLCWGLFTAAALVNFFLLMTYFEGKLDRIFASRLALPMYVCLILAPCIVLGIKKCSGKLVGGLILVISVYILAWTLPANDRELFTKRNYVQNELDWLMDVVGPDVLEKDLVIDHKSTGWTLIEKQALRPRTAMENLSVLERRQASGAYENIYYVERLEYVVGNDGFSLEASRLPDGVFELQPLLQRSFRPFSVVRLYRVSAIHPERLPEGFLDRTPHGNRPEYDYNGL